MKRFEGNGHVLVVCEERAILGRKIVERRRLESTKLREVGKEQRRQSRSAGRKEFGFGYIPSGIGHRAGTAKGRRERAVAAGCSSTVAIKWWAKWRNANGERLSATFWASRRCSFTS